MKVIRGAQIEYVPASHEDPRNPGVFKRILAIKEDLFPGRVQMINWARLPVGGAFRAHYHEDMEEIFVIVIGAVVAKVDGAEIRLESGDAIMVSPCEVHEMRNICTEDVQYIVVGIAGEKNGRTVVV